jgi:serine/threonine kinase 16
MKQIGEGGFAFVYDVMSTANGEHYALKKMICQTDEQLDEAKKEIDTMVKVKHANVLPLLEFAYTLNRKGQKEVLLVLPLYQMGSVQTLIDRGPGYPHCAFTDGLDVLKILRQIVEGLTAIHACGLRHGDLKPANILLSESYQAVITDFGSVSPAPITVHNRTEALEVQEKAAMFTTASYRAPELFITPSECVVGFESDVWSLGCLVYCLLYSRSPFESTTEGLSTLSVMSAHYSVPEGNLWPEEYLKLLSGCLTADPLLRMPLATVQSSLHSIPCPPLNLRAPTPPSQPTAAPAVPANCGAAAASPNSPVPGLAARILSLSSEGLGHSTCSTTSTCSSAVTTGQIAFSATTASSEQGSFPPTPSTGGRAALTAEELNFAQFPQTFPTKDGVAAGIAVTGGGNLSNYGHRHHSKDEFGSCGSALSGLVFDEHNFEGASVFNSSVADSYVIAEHDETLSNLSTGNNSPHPSGPGRSSHSSNHSEGVALTEVQLRHAQFAPTDNHHGSYRDPTATVAELTGRHSFTGSEGTGSDCVILSAADCATISPRTETKNEFSAPHGDDDFASDEEFGEFTTGTGESAAAGVVGIAAVADSTSEGNVFADATSTKALKAIVGTVGHGAHATQHQADLETLPALDLWSLIEAQSRAPTGVIKEGTVFMMRQGGFPKRWAKKQVMYAVLDAVYSGGIVRCSFANSNYWSFRIHLRDTLPCLYPPRTCALLTFPICRRFAKVYLVLTPLGVVLRKESVPDARIHALLSLHRPTHLTPTDTLPVGLNGLLVQGSCPVPASGHHHSGAGHSPVPGGGPAEWVLVQHDSDGHSAPEPSKLTESHPREVDAANPTAEKGPRASYKAQMEPVRFEISFDSKDSMNDWIDAIMERREALLP